MERLDPSLFRIHLLNRLKSPRVWLLNQWRFLADPAVESVNATGRAATLINSARRAILLEAWEGDVHFKNRQYFLLK